MDFQRGGVHVVEEPNRQAIKLGHNLAQRAEILVLASLHKRPPFRVAALANILMVSERALRKVFQDTYGVSPSRYLRRLRLSEARRALLSAQDRMVTVTEIATLFGFAELGRFSVEYRAVFGESPSVTLRCACDSNSPQARVVHARKSLSITGLGTIIGPTGSSEGRFAS
jgi:transcriptional regulator GlxA family with amidase domain